MSITKAQLPRLIPALQSNEWFAQCCEDFQTSLIELAEIKQLGHGEVLFSEHKVPDGIFCILSGRVRNYHVDASRTLLLRDYASYEWIGELPLIDESPYKGIATALGETSLMHISREVLVHWLDETPIYWRDFARLVCHRFRYSVRMLLHATALSLEDRILQRLYLISTGYGMCSTPSSRIHHSQEELANMLGASRSSVTSALSKLAQQGLVELRYGEIHLLKSGSFARLSNGSAVFACDRERSAGGAVKRCESGDFDCAHARDDRAGPGG